MPRCHTQRNKLGLVLPSSFDSFWNSGNREEHQGEAHPKAILVDEGGTLEVHGEPRLSWTKISETQKPLTQYNEDIYFEHEVNL